MQQILAKAHYRRWFFIIFALLLICLGLIRYVLLPQFDLALSLQWPQFLASLIEKLLTSFLVTVLIGSFVFWLEPKVMRTADMTTIEPKEIAMLLRAAIQTTEKWWFRGGTGRYLRAVTLPELAESAQNTSSTKELNVQLIDPTDEALCEAYAQYRRGLKSAKHSQNEWTRERVRKEIYATIVSLLVKAEKFPLLRIEISLLRSFSSFRLDLSSKYVILTKEDPLAPGVRCDYRSYFYQAYMDDLVLTSKQGRSLKLDSVSCDLNLEAVRQRFIELKLIGNGISDEMLGSIIETAKSPRNPYA